MTEHRDELLFADLKALTEEQIEVRGTFGRGRDQQSKAEGDCRNDTRSWGNGGSDGCGVHRISGSAEIRVRASLVIGFTRAARSARESRATGTAPWHT